MKIVKQTIILAALCMLSVGVQARQFEQGEKLYINSDQTIRDGNGKFNWSDAGANLVLYVWKKGKTNSQQWVTLTKESNNLWVGDIKQMPPVVSLNSDRIKRSNYMGLVNGLDFITNNTEVPVYQMTETYRLTERAASYTGIFYQNSLVAKNHATVQPINMLGGLMKPEGGPALILTDLRQGDYSNKEL